MEVSKQIQAKDLIIKNFLDFCGSVFLIEFSNPLQDSNFENGCRFRIENLNAFLDISKNNNNQISLTIENKEILIGIWESTDPSKKMSLKNFLGDFLDSFYN